MAATHGEYRSYLRSTADMEAGSHRLHPSHGPEPTHRPLLFGTLAVMGLLQVASSVAILLHLTGYLQEVGSTQTRLTHAQSRRGSSHPGAVSTRTC